MIDPLKSKNGSISANINSKKSIPSYGEFPDTIHIDFNTNIAMSAVHIIVDE